MGGEEIFMFNEMMPMSQPSGGSGAVSGTCENTTSASEKVEIDTGLSAITRFSLMAKITNSNAYVHTLVYDADINSEKYTSIVVYPTSGYGNCNVNIGTEAHQYAFKLDSITNGKVTLYSPSGGSVYSACDHIRWFAE